MAQGGRIDYTIGFNVDKSGLQNIQKELAKINQMSAKDIQKVNPALNVNEAKSVLMKAKIAANEVQKAMQEAFNPTIGVTNIDKLQSSLKRLNLAEIQKRFSAIGPTGQKAFLDISKSALTTNVQLKQTSKLMDKVGETLTNTIKWQFSSSIVNRFIGTVQQAVGYVQHLDSSLNDIRIVTGKSADEMEVFAQRANKAAQSLGKSTTDYTEASLIYYQQGLADDEVAARAETTLKAANVTGQSTAAVSEELTAVWNGYKVATEDTEAAVDKLAAVAATTASDLEELSTGMSKVASAANSMGVDMDQLNAQIATIISVTRQAPESVGTALKTIYARMSDLKLGDSDEDGLKLGDVSSSLEKVGINILDANGNLREMGDVIEEVAGKWDTWNKAEQAAIAQSLAGKRQYNNLVALFDNWDMYSKALDTSRNSLGTLQSQQDIYMESTEAHIQMLKTELEDLYDSIIDEDAIKGVSDGLRNILNIITNIVDAIGGGKTLITGIIAFVGSKLGKQLANTLAPFINNIQNAKTNAEALAQVYKNLQTYATANSFGDKATEAMREVQEETSQYWHLMSEEEINASMEATRELGTWVQKQEEVKKTTEALENYIAVAGTATQKNALKQGGQIFNQGGGEASSLSVGEVSKTVLEEKNKIDTLKKAYTDLEKEIEKVNNSKGFIGNNEEELKEVSKNVDNLKKKLTSLSTALNTVKQNNEGLLPPGTFEDLERGIEQLQSRLESLRSGNRLMILSDNDREEMKRIEEVLNELIAKYQEYTKVVKEAAEAEDHVNSLRGKFQNNNEELALQDKINGYSQLVGAISSYAFALQSLTNIGSIFNNDDLTDGEKILQIVSALAIAIPMLGGAYKNLTLGLNALLKAKQANAAASAANAVADNAAKKASNGWIQAILGQTSAAKGLSTALKAVSITMIAVTAAITAISFISSQYKKHLEEVAEKTEQTAQAQQEIVDKAKEESESINNLRKNYEELNRLRDENGTFTDEQKQKINDLLKSYDDEHLKVLALVEDYDELQRAIREANAEKLKTLGEGQEELLEDEFLVLQAKIDENKGGIGDIIKADMAGSAYNLALKYNKDLEVNTKLGQNYFKDLQSQLNPEDFKALIQDLKQTYPEYVEILNDIYTAAEGAQKTSKDFAIQEFLSDKDIKNVQEYDNAVEDVAKIKVDGQEIGKEYARSFLAGEYEEFSVGSKQKEEIADILGEDLFNQIQNKYDSYTEDQKNFLYSNAQLAADIGNVDKFWDLYSARKENQESISLVEGYLDKTELKDDDINALFSNASFADSFGYTQEEFTDMSHRERMNALDEYYTESFKKEQAYQQLVQDGINKTGEEVQQKLNEERQAFDKNIEDFQAYLSEEFGEKFATKIYNDLFNNEEVFNAFNKKVNHEKLTDEEKQVLKDADLDSILNPIRYKKAQKALEKYKETTGQTGKTIKSVTKITDNFAASQEELEGILKNNTSAAFKMNAMMKNQKNKIKELNAEIDDIQSNYQSLQSIVEDYNEDGYISLDNVQKLMEMDTKYVATLKFEGDQLSINDEAYQNLTQAEAQNLRIEATELFLKELLAIQNGETAASATVLTASTYETAEAMGVLESAADRTTSSLVRLQQVQAAMKVDPTATKNAMQGYLNRLAMIDNFANQPVARAIGSGGSGSGGGGGSEKDPEHEEYLEREADIYRTINEELEQIESTLERIQNINDHEWGIDAQKTLEQENKLLDQQLEKLQEKKKLQERDLSTRRKQLEDVGVNFSADGSAMTNAESTLDAMYAHYNSMVDMYNAMSAAEQETYKANLEAEKDRIDKVEQKIDDYESTFSDYQSTLDSLIDVHYQQIENTVKQFNNMVDVHLELDEAKEEWNDFWFDVVQDIEDTDFTKQIEKSVKKLEVLIGTTLSNTDSEVSILTNHLLETVSEVQDQIASANRGGEASIFGDDSALSKETLENYRDQLMEALTSAKEELDNISDSYLDMLDSAQDKIDKQVKAWESIGEHLEHNVSLIKLISGDKSYEALDKIYQQQYQNNLQLLTTQRTSMEYWQNMIDKYANLLQTTEEGSKEWKTYSEAYEKASMNYKEAVSNLDKTIEDALNKLEEWKKNQLDAINETFDRTLSSNLGLDQLEKEWNVINDSASRYFDNVERALEMEGLADAFDKVIENTKEASRAQQELNQMRDEEIARLNQKTKLSQFDIDEVKARLEIRKQELALEDAQKNKTNLRLRRDSQGNYNYQYTGDDSQIEEASEGLLSAKKEWYELVKNRNIDLAKAVLENRKNLQSELAALDDMYFENDDARRAKQIEIINKYAEREKDIMGDAESAKQIFFDGTAKFFADVENNTVLPQWNTTIEGMIDAWSGGGEDSFTNAVKRGIEEIEKVQDEFNIRTEEILTKAGVNYIKLKETGIDPTIDSLNELTESNEELESALEEVNDQLIEQESYLRDCEEAYNNLKDAAVNAIAQANSALNTLAQTAINTSQQVQAAISAAQSAAAIMSEIAATASALGGGGLGGSSPGSGRTFSEILRGGANQAGRYGGSSGYERPGISPSSTTGLDSLRNAGKNNAKNQNLIIQSLKNSIRSIARNFAPTMSEQTIEQYASRINFQYGGNASTLTYDQLKRLLGFDSGGYTGAWGSDGRLAMLHEKELVLNKKDTENVLDAVNLLRTFSVSEIADSIIGAAKTSASILASVTSKASQAVAGVSNNQTNNYRDMTINADFSGVKSADAIYQALTELSNYGMQEAYSNSPLANKSY